MATRDQNERSLLGVVSTSLRRWLAKARGAVMAPFEQHHLQPDPTGVFQVQGSWNSEVDTILTEIGRISHDAWSEATDVPFVSRHAFIMSQLAQTQNLMVRMPNEVYNLIFAELTDGINAGETLPQLAARVERVLSWTDTERWPARAKTIAMTETTRAYGAATVAAGLEQSRATGRLLRKKWQAHHDDKTRISHADADGQVRDLTVPFQVGGENLMFPGDPTGSPGNVIGCRCSTLVTNERSG